MGEDTKKAIEAQKRALLESIPEDHAERIREAAANVSGKPKEEISIEDALAILQEINDPEIETNEEETAENLFGNMTQDEIEAGGLFFEQLKRSALDGRLAEITQQIIDAANEPKTPIKTMEDAKRYFDDWAEKLHKIFFTELITNGGDETNQALSRFIQQVVDGIISEAVERIEANISANMNGAAEIPQITAKAPSGIDYPLDKPNSVIWNLITSANPNGQIELKIDTSKKRSKQDSVILYGINFDELTDINITKQLTPFDKRVYIAAAALFNAENTTFTTTQIFYAMGNTKRPNATDLKKINNSLTKMGAARIYINNEQESQQTRGGYKVFKYDASLLPFERISAYVNGTLTDGAIHCFREPPLMSFAKQRNQITTIQPILLASPISKTDPNLQIDDYLLERIAHMKNDKNAKRKILFATIYKHCNITTTKQRQRAPEKIKRYLDYYKKCNWITGYKDQKEDGKQDDGITILL